MPVDLCRQALVPRPEEDDVPLLLGQSHGLRDECLRGAHADPLPLVRRPWLDLALAHPTETIGVTPLNLAVHLYTTGSKPAVVGHALPDRNRLMERELHQAWVRAGKVTFTDGQPLSLKIVALFARPEGHVLKSGRLSRSGERTKAPVHWGPDSGELYGLVIHGLQRRVWESDTQIVQHTVERKWAPKGGSPMIGIRVEPVA